MNIINFTLRKSPIWIREDQKFCEKAWRMENKIQFLNTQITYR